MSPWVISCILSACMCLLPTGSVRYHSRAHHHAKGETNFYRPFRAILPAGAAMPAFLRIPHKGFVLLFVHVDHIQRAGVFTSPASGAQFFVDDRWHTGYSLFISGDCWKAEKMSFPSFRRKPESREVKKLWTPAFAGVTAFGVFYETIHIGSARTRVPRFPSHLSPRQPGRASSDRLSLENRCDNGIGRIGFLFGAARP